MIIFGMRVELLLLLVVTGVSVFFTILEGIGYLIDRYISNDKGDHHGILY